MRSVYRSRAQSQDVTATTAVSDDGGDSRPADGSDSLLGYAADHAAIAFGIPRIAPVLLHQPGSQPGTRTPRGPASQPDPSATFPAEVEDLTESLTADEREVAEVAFPATLAAPAPAAPEPADWAADQALSDPVTAALRMPTSRAREPEAEWGRAQRQPLTERLAVPRAAPEAAFAPRLMAQLSHRGRGPGDAATTTVTLPAAVSSAEPFAFAAVPGAGAARRPPLARWVLLGAGAVVALAIAALAGRALTLADRWPGAAPRPTLPAPRPTAAYRERLIEQAVASLRSGRREQAIALLLRYQASAPAGSSDRTVEILLRVIKKDPGDPVR